jgi:hypothetical protein
MTVLWTDLNLDEDFVFVKWIEYGGDETYSEYLERPVYLHEGFEFLLRHPAKEVV